MARSRSGGTSPGEPTRAERSRGPSLSGPVRAAPAAPTAGNARLLADEDSASGARLDPREDRTDEGSLPDHHKAAHEPLPENERGFGRYTLLRRLAYGGMGEIFLARQGGAGSLAGIAKLVVIKRILSHMKRDEKHRRMFLDEARLQALLTNPHVVQIHDMGEEGGHVYLAMEHVHGPSWRGLVDRCRRNKEHIPLAHVCEMVIQAARGLSYAHNLIDATGNPLKIVHRDINPHNILVTYDGGVKIIDFGIAKSELADGNTETGTIKGKFSYMSPEQSAAKPLDRRSDLFTLGICLYELITLKNPFRRSNVVLSLDAIQRENPPPLTRRRSDAEALQPIVERCLAKDREDRFDDCEDLARALEDLLASGVIPPATVPLSSWLRERFADEIAEHVSILEMTGSSAALVVRGSDPMSLPRMRPPNASGSNPVAPRPPGRTPILPPGAETLVDRPPAGLQQLRAGASGQGAPAAIQNPDHVDTALFTDATDDTPGVFPDLTVNTPPPDAFDVRSIADEMEPVKPSRLPLVAAGVVIALLLAVGITVVVKSDLLAAPTPVPVPVPEPDPDPVIETKPVDTEAKPVDTEAKPVDPEAKPVDPEAKPVEVNVEETKPVEPKPDPAPDRRRRNERNERNERPPVVDKPLVGTLVVQSDGYAVKGSRDLPLGGSTTLSIKDDDAPYRLTVRVKSDAAGNATFDVDTTPWAILFQNGVGKGKTPLQGLPLKPGSAARLELKNPQTGQRMTFSLTLRAK